VVLAACVWTGAGYGCFVLGLLLTGAGVPFVLPSVVAAIVNTAPAGAAGAAGGLLNSARQIGATIGVAVMGTFVSAATGTGSCPPLLLAGGCCAFAAVAFAAATSPRRG
jgi:DHA2 family methylenomycin A resistance protein-like MFS transporter